MGFLEKIFGGHGGHHGHRGQHGSQGGYDGYPQGGRPYPAGASGGTICSGCQTSNAADARYCQKCGVSLAPATCNKCRSTLQAGAKFCSSCGTSTA
ncbi:MAG: zinc ribbon domain-containing protein [Rhodoferax sp.]|nr:zinc ribbon domain-containing protein [Rhodoferax sp.]